jgi:hypothetical protein
MMRMPHPTGMWQEKDFFLLLNASAFFEYERFEDFF